MFKTFIFEYYTILFKVFHVLKILGLVICNNRMKNKSLLIHLYAVVYKQLK